AAAILLLTAFTAAAKQPTTVILIRHAEKAGPSGDVPLSEAGIARGQELARVLADANVKTILVTQFVRTQQTAAAIAKATALTPVVVTVNADYAKAIAAKVAEHPGETLLVVGHNNTTQDVIRQLGIADAPSIAETEYDNLFLVTLTDGAAKLTRLRYGAAAR
ncbi:MAG TPA: phosphoglycerate mutase family protein, partial [Thermoanaerobaculia bacterium]|nr:phosphoglycerate mutase family protein [Thermoanaerobaculia bacterium]